MIAFTLFGVLCAAVGLALLGIWARCLFELNDGGYNRVRHMKNDYNVLLPDVIKRLEKGWLSYADLDAIEIEYEKQRRQYIITRIRERPF